MSFSFLYKLSTRRLSSRLYSSSSSATSQTRTLSHLLRGLILTTSFGTAYTLGALYPPVLATYLSPRIGPPPPDPNSPESLIYTAALEKELDTLPLLQLQRSQPDADEWYETRPYSQFPEDKRVNHLTAGALRGPGKLALRPLIRAKKDESESWVFLHIGRGLCGHDGIVHGGLLATLLDETMARTALFNVPDRVVVTANLTINYRAPTRADQFIVIKTSVTELKGRKVSVSARVEDLEGEVLQEATSVFVQPKYAKLLNAKGSMIKMAGDPEAVGDVQPVVSTSASSGVIKS